jgi:DNA repair photolyase
MNASALLQKELPRYPKDVINIGDWQSLEKRYRLSRQMLRVCLDLKFPVFILEKSDLVVQDLNLLRQMVSKDITVITGFSIITSRDDKTRRLFEPGAPSVKNRFNAMRKFAKAGVLTGTALMPVLPYIYDDDENLEDVIARTKRSGGQYVLVGSLTLSSRQREWFFDALRRYDPSLLQHYERLYDNNTAYAPHPNYIANLGRRVEKLCAEYGLRDRIPRPIPSNHLLAFNMRVAEILYDRAYRLTLKGVTGFREFALRKAGRIVDNQSQDLSDVLEKEGRAGLRAIHGIGPKLSAEIESAILEAKAELRRSR